MRKQMQEMRAAAAEQMGGEPAARSDRVIEGEFIREVPTDRAPR
jgi:hypothetical protein